MSKKTDAQALSPQTPDAIYTPLQRQFREARRVGTPLIAVTTPDPAQAAKAIIAATLTKPKPKADGAEDEKPTAAPAILWDSVKGMTPLNAAGRTAMAQLLLSDADRANLRNATEEDAAEFIEQTGSMETNPIQALSKARNAPPETMIFVSNAQRIIQDFTVAQAVWNLRDDYKASRRTLILFAPVFTAPAELQHDIVTLDDPLPDAKTLALIAEGIAKAVKVKPEDFDAANAVSATIGLSAFAAEQALSMATRRGEDGKIFIDLANVYDAKVKIIEQTRGLRVFRGDAKMSDVGGSANIKNFLGRYLANNSPRVILWLDEIEKMFAGSGTDTSGTSTEILGKVLSWMEDQRVTGVIHIGPPGSGKSQMAKVAGSLAGIPTINCNVGDMKGALVGQSNENLSTALRVIDAVSGEPGKVFAIATCNNIQGLPAEFLARFRLGTFFFDLPDTEERKDVWRICMKRHNVPEQEIPESEGWAGRDIDKCCENCMALDCSLIEAAGYVVSISQSSGGKIEELRQMAHGRFISASTPGPYVYRRMSKAASTISFDEKARQIDIQQDTIGEVEL